MISRRPFLQLAGAGVLSSLIGSRAAFAQAPTDNRMVFVILRGGLDGLHALAPYEDRDFRKLRPNLAPDGSEARKTVLDLDGYFGLHPALAPLHDLYLSNELLLIPAASTQYRSRSHFDGQNMLENGSGNPYGASDGWLNRAINGLNGGDRRLGLALGPSIPLILRGDAGVQTWAKSKLPEVNQDFLAQLVQVYAGDGLFAQALQDANSALQPQAGTMMAGSNSQPNKDFSLSARVAADLLSRAEGPRIAVMEVQGWDTHFNQIGRLDRLLSQVAGGILDLKYGLADKWSKTVVMIVSEFGRTAAENGSRGTDHGTGGIAILAGGAVAGGRIAGDWPGLSQRALYEGRDLRSTTDYEGLFKAALINHMGLSDGFVEDRVFPNSRPLAMVEGLFRNS